MSNLSLQSIFTNIYDNKAWGSVETVSGEGTLLVNTQSIRELIPCLFKELNIRTVVDAPCGDYWWFSHCDVDIDYYVGVDIVKDLINFCHTKYGDMKHSFMYADLCEIIVPRADIIICRSCLIHLSNENSLKLLENFKKSGSTYLLISTDTSAMHNNEIEDGKFRHVNMCLPPFNFPEPLRLLNEKDTQSNGHYTGLSLGLWKIN